MMGHALPLLSLAKTMAQRGHQMIFVSSKGATDSHGAREGEDQVRIGYMTYHGVGASL